MASSHYDLNKLVEFDGDTDLLVQTHSADGKKTPQKATLASSNELNQVAVTMELDDVSTASSTFCPSPVAGTVSTIYTILHGAITVGDATITAEINGVAITGISITVAQSGSAAGDVDSDTATAANTVAVGDSLETISDGGSTDAARLTIVWLIDRA